MQDTKKYKIQLDRIRQRGTNFMSSHFRFNRIAFYMPTETDEYKGETQKERINYQTNGLRIIRYAKKK